MNFDYLPGLSRKKTSRDIDPLPGLLEEWLGKKAAAKEIESRLPPALPISEGVDQALKHLLTAESALIQKIQRQWTEIAGRALVGILTPVSVSNGALFLEVSHPAYMMTFGKQESDLLLAKLDECVGKGKCVRIKLIPAGSERPGVKRMKRRYQKNEKRQ